MHTLATPNVLKKDYNGLWYSLPENMVDSFIDMNEEIQNSEWFSVNWFNAISSMNDMFTEYLKES